MSFLKEKKEEGRGKREEGKILRYLSRNRITDINSLSTLIKLDVLNLRNNPVSRICPLQPESICRF
ncbi:MAG: leucine-rich repeat domain-containing protein [Cyanobacteriota bacterium]|nr:leucine-rich repeat domain-containing protein [Cyanobacteriota bacterium]